MEKALAHLGSRDQILAALIDRYPLPSFKKHGNYYQELVDSIISQQLSVKSAAAIEGRFKDLFGGDFPSPAQILARDSDELRAVGLSRPKIGYIKDLAQKISDKDISFDNLDSLANQEVVDELTKVKGIGEWTAHMFLMFSLGRLDVLPIGDLGIRNGVARLYGLGQTTTPEQVCAVATKNNWRPYESVASWYVWQSLENLPKIG